MKVYFIKKFCCIAVIILVGITTASAKSTDSDTTKLLASVTKGAALKYKQAINTSEEKNGNSLNLFNVKYPGTLQNEREQSLEYVEKYSNKKREYLISTFEKGKKYFPKIVNILNDYQLPEELKVLMALESGFNANVISKAGAVGYWQIMDVVAKEYGLQIATSKKARTPHSKRKDERSNFNKSTLVAAKYLRDRGEDLDNNLLLMVASYNCGLGNVRKAIKKSGKAAPDFWDVKQYLPSETRNYVMNFIALNVIFENYEKFENKELQFSPELKENLITDIPVYENPIPPDVNID